MKTSVSQLKFSFEHGNKKPQELSFRGTKQPHGWSNRALRPHREATTHLSLGCWVAEAQKVWFVQAMQGAEEPQQQRCSLTRSPEEDTQGESWDSSTALLHNDLQGSADTKNKQIKERNLGKNRKMAGVRKPSGWVPALRELWQFPSLVSAL